MPPAARIGDQHTCPMVTGYVSHVGGPVSAGLPTVLIGNAPAARAGDMTTCVGPPDSVLVGSASVLIGNQPAARQGDFTVHGGKLSVGCPTVLIGEVYTGVALAAHSDLKSLSTAFVTEYGRKRPHPFPSGPVGLDRLFRSL